MDSSFMPQRILQEHRDEFDERNNFLFFLLGMISLSQSVLSSFTGSSDSGRVASPDAAGHAGPDARDQDPVRISLMR